MLFLLAFLLAAPCRAQQAAGSPALGQLQQESQKNPAASSTAEGAKNASSQGFAGNSAAPSDVQAPLPTGKAADGQSYVMVGESPIKGINIYTPRLDPSGAGKTEKPKAADLIGKKKIFAAAGLGAAAVIGGAMLGGPFGAVLLVAGGAFLGVAAVLGFLRHKLNKNKAA